ncbi:unnamed protein product, partial [Heterotrigona itama]
GYSQRSRGYSQQHPVNLIKGQKKSVTAISNNS